VSSSSVVVRFPDGSREFRFPPEPLKEGDVIWHASQRFVVIHVTTDANNRALVTVELESEDLIDKLGSEEGAVQLIPLDDQPRADVPRRPPRVPTPAFGTVAGARVARARRLV
jgi:hypothetical protein